MIARMKTQRFLYLHPLIPHVGRYHLLRSIRSRSTARRGQKTVCVLTWRRARPRRCIIQMWMFKSQSRKRARHCLRPDGYL
jgi:hypothetical protein